MSGYMTVLHVVFAFTMVDRLSSLYRYSLTGGGLVFHVWFNTSLLCKHTLLQQWIEGEYVAFALRDVDFAVVKTYRGNAFEEDASEDEKIR